LSLFAAHPDIGEAKSGWRRKGPARSCLSRARVRFSRMAAAGAFSLTDIARIIEVVEPEVKALGFDLVRVRIFGKSEVGDDEIALQIMAENPATGQLVLDDCATLSHRISDRFDVLESAGETLIQEAYRLEVSSPGIDRPLTRPKDFAKWVGHEAKISSS
jgi:ribosome maturation factor RimP